MEPHGMSPADRELAQIRFGNAKVDHSAVVDRVTATKTSNRPATKKNPLIAEERRFDLIPEELVETISPSIEATLADQRNTAAESKHWPGLSKWDENVRWEDQCYVGSQGKNDCTCCHS